MTHRRLRRAITRDENERRFERSWKRLLGISFNPASRTDLEVLTRLSTIPGVDLITARTLLAELGSDMRVFADAKHVSSWAGLCPGHHESGGKRLSNRTRKGNRWLRRAMCQAAWGLPGRAIAI